MEKKNTHATHSTTGGAFPATVWPVHRSERAAAYSGAGALGVWQRGNMLAAVGANTGAGAGVRWLAQSEPSAQGVRQQARMLRVATHVPGLLEARAPPPAEEMVAHFERMHAALDIPRDLLLGLFGDAVSQPEPARAGSLVAVAGRRALFAGGPAGTQLWAQQLGAADAACVLELAAPLRQVSARAAFPGLCGVRTDGVAALVRLRPAPSMAPAAVDGAAYDLSRGDRRTCHAAWSPWAAAEAALASSTGAVRLWDAAAARQTELTAGGGSGAGWAACEFWGAPRVLLTATGAALGCVDARARRTALVLLDVAASPHTSAGEALTAAAPSALHAMHAVVASTHALRLYDRRYARQPLLAWAVDAQAAPAFVATAAVAGRGVIVVATRAASVSVFDYAQPAPDAPLAAGAQTALRLPPQSARAMQDACAIDPSAPAAPRVPLAGIALSAAGDGPALCLALDALGGLAEMRLGPGASPAVPASAESPRAHCRRREEAWERLRMSGAPVERLDLRPAYNELHRAAASAAASASASAPFGEGAAPEDQCGKLAESLAAVFAEQTAGNAPDHTRLLDRMWADEAVAPAAEPAQPRPKRKARASAAALRHVQTQPQPQPQPQPLASFSQPPPSGSSRPARGAQRTRQPTLPASASQPQPQPQPRPHAKKKKQRRSGF
ncbi:hypothetical protein LPJ66_004216 [Kickxella alabastrina]|uniref:Uncharacterized protein n=1 Tax=Kickxella alabastrina TaxID=61397 RepID=A0ACC1IN26_9FUNG|nr:hypothetical protein LPJ66_004216 [Kickxella alabastrina]